MGSLVDAAGVLYAGVMSECILGLQRVACTHTRCAKRQQQAYGTSAHVARNQLHDNRPSTLDIPATTNKPTCMRAVSGDPTDITQCSFPFAHCQHQSAQQCTCHYIFKLKSAAVQPC